jgi:hypothetical protein
MKHFANPRGRLLDSCENEAHQTQDILQLLINQLHIQRDREEWPRIAAEAITAPPLIMGLPRTDTGPAPNPEEIPPLVGHWSRQLPDL